MSGSGESGASGTSNGGPGASNALHLAFRKGEVAEEEQLALLESSDPRLLDEEDETWEGWLPVHNAARWGVSERVMAAALHVHAEAAKCASKGGYEPLHLGAMGGHVGAVSALLHVYPEGAFKKDANGRTPLDEARENGHEGIVDAILALPGAREMDEAEAQLRAARVQELMRPDDMSDSEEPLVVGESADGIDEEEEGEGSAPARSLANRMLRAASNALWRREEEVGEANRAQLAAFFVERAKCACEHAARAREYAAPTPIAPPRPVPAGTFRCGSSTPSASGSICSRP